MHVKLAWTEIVRKYSEKLCLNSCIWFCTRRREELHNWGKLSDSGNTSHLLGHHRNGTATSQWLCYKKQKHQQIDKWQHCHFLLVPNHHNMHAITTSWKQKDKHCFKKHSLLEKAYHDVYLTNIRVTLESCARCKDTALVSYSISRRLRNNEHLLPTYQNT